MSWGYKVSDDGMVTVDVYYGTPNEPGERLFQYKAFVPPTKGDLIHNVDVSWLSRFLQVKKALVFTRLPDRFHVFVKEYK